MIRFIVQEDAKTTYFWEVKTYSKKNWTEIDFLGAKGDFFGSD